MKQKISLLLFTILFSHTLFAKAFTGSDTVLPGAALKPVGRYLVDENNNLELISSAVHFTYSFSGKTCTVYAFIKDDAGHNYIQYELDGVYQERIKIMGGGLQQVSLNANSDGHHTITIYKTTEAQTGPVFIQKIAAGNIHAVQQQTNEMIEFIGNSITCGAAADTSETPCGKGVYHDQHNAYYAYGPRVARALHLNFMLSSVSGIGIYRNWNSDGPAMPAVYEKARLVADDNVMWNFKTYSPKVVSIALGTNDMSHGDGVKKRAPFDSAVYVQHYIDFIKLVKSKYPEARIALLSSPMMNGEQRALLQNCITAVKQNIDGLYKNDKPVAVYFFSPMHAGGCGGHPSVEDHGLMADQLIPFFKQLL
jgi:hypothetical protein